MQLMARSAEIRANIFDCFTAGAITIRSFLKWNEQTVRRGFKSSLFNFAIQQKECRHLGSDCSSTGQLLIQTQQFSDSDGTIPEIMT